MPLWVRAALASAGALATYAVVSAGTFAATQRLDPSLATLERNRYLASGLAVIGGLALCAFKPSLALYGAGIAGAGVVVAVGSKAAIALGGVLEPARAQTPVAALYAGDAYPRLAGVYGQNVREYAVPANPWASH